MLFSPVIAFFNSFSGIRHVSYAKPRVPLGAGCASIEFPGYNPGLFMEVKSNTPVQTLTVCMAPAVFVKLTGKSSDGLAEMLGFLDRNADERSKFTPLKGLDFAKKTCGYQALASFMDNPRDKLFLEAKALELVAKRNMIFFLRDNFPACRTTT